MTSHILTSLKVEETEHRMMFTQLDASAGWWRLANGSGTQKSERSLEASWHVHRAIVPKTEVLEASHMPRAIVPKTEVLEARHMPRAIVLKTEVLEVRHIL
jgi:hypothetical protein